MRVKTEEIFAFLGELEVEKENIKLENVAVKNISTDQNPMGSTENATLQAFMNQYEKLKNIVEKYNETITRDIADVQKAVEKIAETDAKLADEIAK